MAISDDDLRSRLPRGVLSDLGRWTRYQSFRTFTWPWLLRRGLLVWPLAVLTGAAFAGWHAASMGAWSDWPPLALRSCAATLLAVSAGPILATVVRHIKAPLAVERVAVLVAIALGLWAGWLALHGASAYHDRLMVGHASGLMQANAFGRSVSQVFRTSLDASVLVWFIAGGGLAAIYYLSERQRIARYAAQRQIETLRADRDAADLRLAVLQAQVEPHFLFNTLASLRSLIATDPRRATQTIDGLAAYLRAALPRLRDGDAAEATLDQQIDLCRGYLDLMSVRMAGRLKVSVEADASVRALPFPPLLLLTLVENAVAHGIEPKLGPGTIKVSARVEAGMLIVEVEDDGGGLKPGLTPGVGLANVRAQLRSLYGDQGRLEILSNRTGGVTARISTPNGPP